MMNSLIEIRHLKKHFGSLEVLNDIDFHCDKGEVITIIGSSGSGKSTLLRCINLLETPDAGEILYHGKDILKGELNINEHRTHVGMVFQSFNLFNNKTVLENCMIGQVKVLKRSKEEAKEKAMHYLLILVLCNYQVDRNSVLRLLVHYVWILKYYCLMNLQVLLTQKW